MQPPPSEPRADGALPASEMDHRGSRHAGAARPPRLPRQVRTWAEDDALTPRPRSAGPGPSRDEVGQRIRGAGRATPDRQRRSPARWLSGPPIAARAASQAKRLGSRRWPVPEERVDAAQRPGHFPFARVGGEQISLCSLATRGMSSATASPAAHQAPNMWAWTRCAPTRRGRSQVAKSCEHSYWRPALRPQTSTSTPGLAK